MSFSVARLLVHNQEISNDAREAVRAAYEAPHERQSELLAVAARILHQQTNLDCSDVRDLFAL